MYRTAILPCLVLVLSILIALVIQPARLQSLSPKVLQNPEPANLAIAPEFEDVTLALGIATLHQQNTGELSSLTETLGGGICVLDANAHASLYQQTIKQDCIYVLGNESSGISAAVQELADSAVHIPMCNGVESLNVAVTAALITFLPRQEAT